MVTLSVGPAKPVIWLLLMTTLLLPLLALKPLTVRALLPAPASMVRVAAMPARLPVLVGALEVIFMVSSPPPVFRTVGLLIDWMLAVSFRSPRSMLIEETPESGPLAVCELLERVQPALIAPALRVMVAPESVRVSVPPATETDRALVSPGAAV